MGGCGKSRLPATNADFWNRKFSENARRDRRNLRLLRRLGWDVLVLWECELKKSPRLQSRLQEFLRGPDG
jgi:DNA mismatch endonuclease (patch repair protein)